MKKIESVELVGKTFSNANILSVAVGTNCPKGGDAGHGGVTILQFEDGGATAWEVVIDGQRIEYPETVQIIFKGDSEHKTIVDALKFAANRLEAK